MCNVAPQAKARVPTLRGMLTRGARRQIRCSMIWTGLRASFVKSRGRLVAAPMLLMLGDRGVSRGGRSTGCRQPAGRLAENDDRRALRVSLP